MTDTTRTIEIEGSPEKLALLVLIGVLMAGVSALLAFLNPDLGFAGRLVGWAGMIFFGLCTLGILWRFLAQRGCVITIAPQGIRDTRIGAGFIPWSAVKNISTWSFFGQDVMVLLVDPAVEASLPLSAMARWTRSSNRALGADGLAVSASGVKTDYGTLLATSTAYWQAANRPR